MDVELSRVPGLGPSRIRALEAAGIRTAREMVLRLPSGYRDLSHPVPLANLRAGDEAAVYAKVEGNAAEQRAAGLLITRVYVSDGTGAIPVAWYNQPWLKKQLQPGRELLLYGRVEFRRGTLQMTCPAIERERAIVPVYRPVAGVPPKAFRDAMRAVLKINDGQWPDELPQTLRERFTLCERNFAMRNAHFPLNPEALEAARRRLAFEELLLYQVALSLLRGGAEKGVKLDFPDEEIGNFWKLLGFPATAAQKRVLYEMAGDLRRDAPMARLLQGDVGSGKTAVAFGVIYLSWKSGRQAAMMAPTEVLAQQHFAGARALFEPLGMKVGLLTGSLSKKQHAAAHAAIASGEWDAVFGTHALITETVEYSDLGLVITDEQHRFGVRQRSVFGKKGGRPNVLVMSATPIPRTLSLILYGDLDLSILDELPPGRTPIKTRVVPEEKRRDMYGFVRREAQKGRQAYVICPLVSESEAVEAKSAEELFEELKKLLPDLRLSLVHGRMKSKDKDAALDKFRAGGTDVLVSTTVVEVGVNVPNASVMVVENAERFGLAQL
ncbi:MAG: ATP-dependent DNA helicase RecG, partial [Clostridiales bacterium]|nr:ATP-dependent DNA helicase RecG [Clostridiales bacterium]